MSTNQLAVVLTPQMGDRNFAPLSGNVQTHSHGSWSLCTAKHIPCPRWLWWRYASWHQGKIYLSDKTILCRARLGTLTPRNRVSLSGLSRPGLRSQLEQPLAWGGLAQSVTQPSLTGFSSWLRTSTLCDAAFSLWALPANAC